MFDADEEIQAEAPITRASVHARARRFAVLRAAQRALDPSSAVPSEGQLDALSDLRAQLGRLTVLFEDPDGEPDTAGIQEEIQQLDGALDGYSQMLCSVLERVPLAQLRASLKLDTHDQRVEVAALLELCLESEPHPLRHLSIVDYLVTLLSANRRDGRWIVELDPADLNDTLRNRCFEVGQLDSGIEAMIVQRFQKAAQCVIEGRNPAGVMQEISAYKMEIASFYFVPSILRCIIGYNVAARNYFDERVDRERELDAEINDELGLFAPLHDDDPRAAMAADDSFLPPHESPGVVAVQTAIRHRLLEQESAGGAADEIAAGLDLSWLEPNEREAFIEASAEDGPRITRMTVVLGHLALSLPRKPREAKALGLDELHIDRWICELGDEVQREIDSYIKDNSYDGALRLGDTKSRFLAAVLLVARRRLGRRRERIEVGDSFDREAIDLVAEFLERERLLRQPRVFHDLLGGGWRRTAVFAVVALTIAYFAVGELMPVDEPRAAGDLSARQVATVSPVLDKAYRDHADEGSIFVGIVGPRWHGMNRTTRRQHADVIQAKVQKQGVEEVLLFDKDNVLQARFAQGAWREPRSWRN